MVGTNNYAAAAASWRGCLDFQLAVLRCHDQISAHSTAHLLTSSRDTMIFDVDVTQRSTFRRNKTVTDNKFP